MDNLNKIKDVIKNNIILFFGIIIFLIIISVIFKQSSILVVVIFIIGLVLFTFSSNKIVTKIKRAYDFFHNYSKALFYSIIFFIIVIIISSIIPSVISDDYYLIISDLPKEYIDKGYSKEVLTDYILQHTSSINNSDKDDLKLDINPKDNFIKLEVLGNAVYINQTILLFRKIIGNNKMIKFHFGVDNDSLFYRGTLLDTKKIFISNKIKNNSFSENDINTLTRYSINDMFKYTHFKKLISFYSNDLQSLTFIEKEIEDGYVKPTDEELFYFYLIYGKGLNERGDFDLANKNYDYAFNLFNNRNINRIDDFRILIINKALNLYQLGKSKEGIELIKKHNIKNAENHLAFLYASLGEDKTAIKLYEKILKTKMYNLFYINQLISLYEKNNEYNKVIKLSELVYKEFDEDMFIYKRFNALMFLGYNKKANELFQKISLRLDVSKFTNGQFDLMNELSYKGEKKIINNIQTNFNNLELLSKFYPNTRTVLQEMMMNDMDFLLVKRTYHKYIKLFPKDKDMTLSYYKYLNNDIQYKDSIISKLYDDELKNRGFNEYLFTLKSISKLNKDSNFKINEDTLHMIKDTFFRDLLYQSNLERMDIKPKEIIVKLDSLSFGSVNIKNKILSYKISDYIFSELSIIDMQSPDFIFEHKKIISKLDPYITKSLRGNINNKKTWLYWGIIRDLQGLHKEAELKYARASDGTLISEPMIKAAEFFYDKKLYGLASINYKKAIRSDSITDYIIIRNFYKSFLLDKYHYSDEIIIKNMNTQNIKKEIFFEIANNNMKLLLLNNMDINFVKDNSEFIDNCFYNPLENGLMISPDWDLLDSIIKIKFKNIKKFRSLQKKYKNKNSNGHFLYETTPFFGQMTSSKPIIELDDNSFK